MLIHQIWWQGESQIPPKFDMFRDAMDAFLMQHDEHQHMMWDESSCLGVIRDTFPYGLEVFDKLKLVEKCDMARLAILFKYGGIYLDMDFLVLPKFNEFLEMYPNGVVLPQEPFMVNNYMILSPSPQSPVIKALFDECVKRITNPTLAAATMGPMIKTLETTGPTMFSKVLHVPEFRHMVTMVDTHDLRQYGYHTAESDWVENKNAMLMNASGVLGVGLDAAVKSTKFVSKLYVSTVRHELFLPAVFILATTLTVISPSLLLGLFVFVLVLYVDLRMYATTMNQTCHNHLSAYLAGGAGVALGYAVKRFMT